MPPPPVSETVKGVVGKLVAAQSASLFHAAAGAFASSL